MALKTTQHQLKKKFKQEILELKTAIKLQCANCMGFFLDPYSACIDNNCPLRKYYPRPGTVKSKNFKLAMAEVAKGYDNPKEIMSEITEVKAKGSLQTKL